MATRIGSFTCVVTLATALAVGAVPARAEPPREVPLPEMVATADHVVLAKVDAVRVVGRPADYVGDGFLNAIVTLHTTAVLRGKPPRTFKVRTDVYEHRNP